MNSDQNVAPLVSFKDEIGKEKVLLHPCNGSMKTKVDIHYFDFELSLRSPDLALSDFSLFADLAGMVSFKDEIAKEKLLLHHDNASCNRSMKTKIEIH